MGKPELPPYYPFLQAIMHNTVTTVVKFEDPDGRIYKALRRGEPLTVVKNSYKSRLIEEKEVEGNVLLIEGAQFMWTCLNTPANCNPPFDGNNTYVGVGDGTTPEDPTQTGLMGTNVAYQLVDSGYPIINQNTFTARATFGPTEANFCYTPDHEVLTLEGWKPIFEVREGELVATIDEHGNMSYEPVVAKTVFRYKDYAYAIQNSMIDLVVTKDHKFYVRNEWWRKNGGGFDLIPARELEKGTWEMKKNAIWNMFGPTDIVIQGIEDKYHPHLEFEIHVPAKEFTRLLGIIVAEGYVNGPGVYITQSKAKNPATFEHIMELARASGFSPKEYDGKTIFIGDARLARALKSMIYKNGHKNVPLYVRIASREIMAEFLIGLLIGDGTVAGKPKGVSIRDKDKIEYLERYFYGLLKNGRPDVEFGIPTLVTTSPYVRDVVQEMAMKLGLCADYRELVNKKSFGKKVKYVISLKYDYCTPYAVYRHDDIKKSHLIRIPYDGIMVGIAVPRNHTLYVRRNGKAVWSGNSWNEWTIANGNSNTAINLNRKVEALGTKASGSTWVLQVSIQLT